MRKLTQATLLARAANTQVLLLSEFVCSLCSHHLLRTKFRTLPTRFAVLEWAVLRDCPGAGCVGMGLPMWLFVGLVRGMSQQQDVCLVTLAVA